MICGFGMDIAAAREFEAPLSEESSAFLERCFTAGERETCRARPEGEQALALAARYAAKEAFLKALDGPRLGQDRAFVFRYPEAEVCNDEGGRPYLRFHGRALDFLGEIGVEYAHLSLSHSGDYAVAGVVLERRAPGDVPVARIGEGRSS